MPNILYPPPRPQSVGEILDSAFRIFRATLLGCLPYATIAVIAGQLPNIYYLATGRSVLHTMLTQNRDPIWWLLYALGILMVIVLSSAILLRQYAIATGRLPSTGAELSTPLRRILGIVAMCFLSGWATCVWFLPAAAFHGPAQLMVLLIALVPASCVALALSSALAVFLLTGKGPLASMIDSARLTWGSWWRLTLIYTVALILLVVLDLLSTVIAGVISLLFAHGDIAVITATTTVVVLLMSAIGTPFFCAMMLAVFGDLTARREGADLAQRLSAPATL